MCTLAIPLICYVSRNRVTFPVYIIPIVFSLLSIIVILISFIWGRWKGLGLGAIGLVLLLASILSSILAALLVKINERK
ncbi:YesK family protein [Bacillus smithii]|uniref:YesK family protein n=1 Tax=Bacillus smithii TaxID=1479 RepID=UPI003D226521